MRRLQAPSILQQILAPPPPAPRGLHLLVGPRSLQRLVLSYLARPLHENHRFYWIDAGNRFDAYGLGRFARARQLNERRVLQNLQLARPFTAIQMNHMLAEQLPRIPEECPVVLADPMALFYDPELPAGDVRRIFNHFLQTVRQLQRPVLTLGVTRPVPPELRGLTPQLLKHVRSLAAIRLDETSTLTDTSLYTR